MTSRVGFSFIAGHVTTERPVQAAVDMFAAQAVEAIG